MGQHAGAGEGKRYIYKSTAVKKYGLTAFQIEEAVRLTLIKGYKYVRNPHYSRAPQALLVN